MPNHHNIKRLSQFLKEFNRLKTKFILNIESYEKTLWLSDIPKEKECFSIIHNSKNIKSKQWIEIKKPKREPCPKPPQEIEPWLKNNSWMDCEKEPKLFPYIISDNQNEAENNKIFLENCPQAQKAFKDYLNQTWRAWAKEERRLAPVRKVYDSFYEMYKKAEEQGEVYQTVLGIGFLFAKNNNGKQIKRHIVTSPLSISFNPENGVIKAGPPKEGVDLSLEMDMLTENEKPKESDDINEKLTKLENDFWENREFLNCLQAWINSYDTNGQVYPKLDKPTQHAESFPVLTVSPAIILRKRNERVFTKFYEHVIQDIDDNPKKDLPCLQEFNKEKAPTHKDNHSTNKEKNHPLAEKHYFPLPINEEQKKILKQITFNNQAVVQGPPGTGKSHSIANLICHFLSVGKKILITSQTDRALKVLKSKLPEKLQPLCVEILGRDQSAFEKLKTSFSKIHSKKQHWQDNETSEKIDKLEQKDDNLKGDLANIQSKLFKIKQSETIEYEISGYFGKLAHIAAKLKDEESQCQWISKEFDLSQKDECPISNSEAMNLLKITKKLKDMDERLLREPLEFLDQALSLKNLSELVKEEKEAMQTIENLKDCEGVAQKSFYKKLKDADFNQIEKILSSLLSKTTGLLNRNEDWVKKALTDCLSDKDREWKYLYDSTNKTLDKSLFEKAENIKSITGLPKEARSNSKLTDLHLTNLLKDFFNKYKKEDKINWGFFASSVVQKLKKIKINGTNISSYEEVQRFNSYIQAKQALDKLNSWWKNQGVETTTKERNFIRNYHIFKDYLEPLEECIAIHKLTEGIKQILNPYNIPYPCWKEAEAIETEIMIMDFIKARQKLEKAKIAIKNNLSFLEKRKAQKNQIAKKMILSIKKRDLREYEQAFQEASLLKKKQKEFKKLSQIRDKLNDEFFYEKIKKDISRCDLKIQDSTPFDQKKEQRDSRKNTVITESEDNIALWESRLNSFEKAWAWGKADKRLKEQTSEKHHKQLIQKKEELLDTIQKNMEELVAEKSWRFCLSQITGEELSSLDGWIKSIKKIGKGTGKTAGKHRKIAKKRMEECKGAVPAWVMPLYRAAENINPSSPPFDIAIIDEASQTGPDGFLLNYIAKKIIVVGDEEQISPENPGITDDDVEILKKKYLSGIKSIDYIGREYSYYDYCSQRFTASRIQLREHFRCMPEIIKFSNDISYSGTPLWPLRQYGSDRLTPLKTAYVENAISKRGLSSHPQNKKEAEAIANQIKLCIKDPAYKNKTFGVIVLQGKAQIELIEKALSEIDKTEMEKRSLRVGSAYDFQGDERDVIFLSMAIAKDWNKTALTKESYKKLYNVASSRAKDQMWLFHSVERSDLSKNDFRRKLLDHCMSDPEKMTVWPPEKLQKLYNKIKEISNKSPDNAPEPFDSWFEARVFLKIAMKGYQAHPQHKAAGYKIDMVILGSKKKLAVECDGDYWHEGEEQERQDMERQYRLERCGWTFWRLRESLFNRDEDSALKSLWELLDKMEIEPLKN